jgi:hypothetical protein
MNTRGLTCEITGEVKYDGNATAKVIEIKKDDLCVEKYHIDLERGFLCPYMRSGNENAAFEFSARDYIQEKHSSLYYLQFYSASAVMPKMNVNNTQEFRLVPDTLQFNLPIADEEFSLEIPANACVHDWHPKKSFSGLTKEQVQQLVKEENRQQTRSPAAYRTSQKGTVSFADDSYKIEKQSWIVPMETHKPAEEVIAEVEEQHKKRTAVFWRIGAILFGIGILLIVVAILLLLNRKRKK